MGYLVIIIAFGIILLFAYWSGNRRTKLRKSKITNLSKVHPLSKSKSQAKLHRIK